MENLESKLRDSDVPTPDTIEELNLYIKSLLAFKHDYGSSVYAMSLASVATFNFMARQLRVSGFQASCADLDIIKRTRNLKFFKIVNGEHLLYPQYDILDEIQEWLTNIQPDIKKSAQEKLKGQLDFVHPRVIQHWKWLAGEK